MSALYPKNAELDLTGSEMQALHVALFVYLSSNDVSICGETVTGKYAERSQLDVASRLAIRVNRYLLGGKHYNNAVEYAGQPLEPS